MEPHYASEDPDVAVREPHHQLTILAALNLQHKAAGAGVNLPEPPSHSQLSTLEQSTTNALRPHLNKAHHSEPRGGAFSKGGHRTSPGRPGQSFQAPSAPRHGVELPSIALRM